MAIPPRSQTKGYERLNRRVDDRSARARESLRANRGEDDRPGEDLVCPSCRQHFAKGSTCLECDVQLVGESYVDVWEPAASDRSGPRLAVFALAIPVLVFGLSYLLNWMSG